MHTNHKEYCILLNLLKPEEARVILYKATEAPFTGEYLNQRWQVTSQSLTDLVCNVSGTLSSIAKRITGGYKVSFMTSYTFDSFIVDDSN